MNKQLIRDIITTNELSCPEFTFENPLLDKEVAKKLSKSFVKMLNMSQQNTNENKNWRLTILENIRNVCKIEPNHHVKLDEDTTEILKEVYKQKYKNKAEQADSTNKNLDAFLIRNMKNLNINSSCKSSMNPEILQAFHNLDNDGVYQKLLLQDIIHWDSTDKKNIHILKSLWASGNPNSEDIYIQLKSEIERILLEICNTILTDTSLCIEELFVINTALVDLVKKSSESPNCFQICCAILNYIFIKTNFNDQIQKFVQMYVEYVKQSCCLMTFTVLYPTHITHIAVLLDMDLELLTASIKNAYVDETLNYLTKIEAQSGNDLIMLLCHFPQWFDIYFHKHYAN